MAMFVRMGTFRIKPDTLDALRERYYTDCAPVVRAAAGNVDCYVLEPVEVDAPIVVCTVWQTEADAVAYEASGSAAEVVGRVREFFARPPELRSYRIHRT
jgi:heme-degrading monooxygenase HmoA